MLSAQDILPAKDIFILFWMSSDVLPDLLHTVDNHQDGNVVAESVIQNATPTGAP